MGRYQRGSAASDRPGRLVLAGTPIGNLADASVRLKQTLADADIIAAEDTRVTRSLLHKLHIDSKARRLISFNEQSEAAKAAQLLDEIESGAQVILVSDAGMPAISDPGYRLVSLAHERGLRVTAVPGPSAVTAALALSGLPTDRFVFEGFIRRKHAQKKRQFEELRAEARTLVFFESPYRLAESLQVMAQCFGSSRQAAVVREITKVFEEAIRDDLGSLAAWAESSCPKGEIVVLVHGAAAEESSPITPQIVEEVAGLRQEGLAHREAVRIVAQKYGVSRRVLYERTLGFRQD